MAIFCVGYRSGLFIKILSGATVTQVRLSRLLDRDKQMNRKRLRSLGISLFIVLGAAGCDRIVVDVLPTITLADITTNYVALPTQQVAIDLKNWPNLKETATFRIDKQPQTGSLTLEKDGLLLYSPNTSFIAGDDNFTVSIDPDGSAKKPTAIPLTISMATSDDKLPCTVGAVADGMQTPLNKSVAIAVLKNDQVCDGILNPASLFVKIAPKNGTASIEGETIVYTPNANFIGRDSFIYRVSTTGTATPKRYIAVVVIRVGQPSSDCKQVLNNDVVNYRQLFVSDSVFVPVLANDELCKSPQTTPITITKAPAVGSANIVKRWNGPIFSQLVVYKPTAGAPGPDELTYQRCEGSTCQTATVRFQQQAIASDCQLAASADQREVSLSQSVNDLKNGVLLLPVLLNDKICQPLTAVRISSNPSNATITVLPRGILKYQLGTSPAVGTVAFTYELTDSNGNQSSAEVKIVVKE